MLVNIQGLDWNVCSKTQGVVVVITSLRDVPKYVGWKNIVQGLIKDFINHSGSECNWVPHIRMKLWYEYTRDPLNAIVLSKWALHGFRMEVHAVQSLSGWEVPWTIKGTPFVGDLKGVWGLREDYQRLGIDLRILIGSEVNVY